MPRWSAAGCQVVIADRATPGTAATFEAAPDLLAFLRCAVDISTVDTAAASAHGVLVTRATPGFTDAVAELGIGMMIALARGLAGAAPRRGTQLSEATLGLIGFGRIARRLAVLAQAFGMRVLAHASARATAGRAGDAPHRRPDPASGRAPGDGHRAAGGGAGRWQHA